MSEIQMSLFGESESKWGTESRQSTPSEWSYSRRVTLEQCARKYYYGYYGSKLQKAKNDPQKEKLRFLEKLQNRHLRTGKILHRIIKTYLKKLQDGKPLSFNWLQQMGLADFQKDIRFSQKYKHGTPLPDEEYPPALLLEFYYGFPDAESLCAEAEERLITALTNFITSQNLEQYRKGARKASALIEKPVRLKEADFTLKGTIDLAYREGDNIVIVDWKIGSAGNSDDSLQMSAYTWLAKQEFKRSVKHITSHRVHLADDTVSTFNLSEKGLRRVEARILQDLDRMQEVDKFGKRGLVEAFTPCAQPKVCEMCQFQEVCPKE